jgi:hypothetical protein
VIFTLTEEQQARLEEKRRKLGLRSDTYDR